MARPDVVGYILERIGSEARVVDAVVTTTLPSETPPGPQKLHFDIKLRRDAARSGTLVKLVFSTEQRPLLTEFGMARTPMKAPACMFDAVRRVPCPFKLIALCPAPRTQESCLSAQGSDLHGAPAAEQPPRADKVFLAIADPTCSNYSTMANQDGWSTVGNKPKVFEASTPLPSTLASSTLTTTGAAAS